MSDFVLWVQTGLLAYASIYGSFGYTKERRAQRQHLNMVRALGDARLLEQHYQARAEQSKQQHPRDSVGFYPLNLEQANEFIRWATEGTEYAWIKDTIGSRAHRPY